VLYAAAVFVYLFFFMEADEEGSSSDFSRRTTTADEKGIGFIRTPPMDQSDHEAASEDTPLVGKSQYQASVSASGGGLKTGRPTTTNYDLI